MPRPTPQFKANVALTFEEHNETGRDWFEFGEDGHRRVPMSMEFVEGLHTVGLWISGAARFHKGDAFDAECIVIWPEGFTSAVVPGRTAVPEFWLGGTRSQRPLGSRRT